MASNSPSSTSTCVLGGVELGFYVGYRLLGHLHRGPRLVALRLSLACLQPRFGPQGGQLTASGLVGGPSDRLHGIGGDRLERVRQFGGAR
ncbi:hypothetical protein [Cupriavidus basilensis]|uniref:hypothetical protein n=1 Tax=Cupriavidus basilensis TaxID=68895 RepID=UPI0023E8B610|nr:hypothetical protein [Cupriavidus basilensis]MDF3883019.1 hypothetical protein [Cupriavidus basilensis]